MTMPHPATRPLSPLVAASLAVLSLSSATAARIAAQEPDCRVDKTRIVGFVVDAGNESPLASVLVSVESPDRASLTTDNGRFLLCDIGPGERVLTASRLGYDTLRIRIGPNPSGEPLRLRLEPDPIILEGLEIVTDRFERRRRAGFRPRAHVRPGGTGQKQLWVGCRLCRLPGGSCHRRVPHRELRLPLHKSPHAAHRSHGSRHNVRQ